MLTRRRGLRPLPLLLAVLPTLVGCGAELPPTVDPVLAVAVTTLNACQPDAGVRVVGVAEPYREAEVAFEVSGRLTAVLDVGRSVEVKTKKGADGRPVHTGDVIAQIDTTTYRQRFEGAELKRTTAESGLKAQLVDLEQVAPATVARAKAQRDAALSQVTSAHATIASAESAKKTTEADLQRQKQLLGDRQISKAEFDRSQNEFETAVANLAKANAGLQVALDNAGAAEATVSEVEASIRLKAETVAQARNQLNELALVVAQAQTDLDRCTLRAPFSGRITYVYASNGDFMASGKPVLRLTLIDPIKISATVSSDLERTVQPGNYARVEPKNLEEYQLGETALFGTVFEKGAVADPATRTFRIDVMVRNARRLMAHDVAKSVTRVNFRNLLPAVERNFGEEGPLFVCSDCLVEEDGKQVVYRLKGAKFGKPRPPGMFDSTLPLERIEVNSRPALEADYMQILNWSFQRATVVEGSGPVNIGDLLLSFEGLDPKTIDTTAVVMERYEWAVRPGDLVPVTFRSEAAPHGIWVPDAAIVALNDAHTIYSVTDGVAKALDVTVHESVGRMRRVEGAGVTDGITIVMVGSQYLFDGAKVNVTRTIDLEGWIRRTQ